MSSDYVDVEPDLWGLRRCKGDDELALIRNSIGCLQALYQEASRVIRPGLSELDLYNQLHSLAVRLTGAPVDYFGNDFQCGSPGGPPRPRAALAGELWILDLAINTGGYFADLSRTFAVSRELSDEQHRAWDAVTEVLTFVEKAVRPGVSAGEVYRTAKQRLDETVPEGCFHHLGHGLGLTPHEAPHLNDCWDDRFQVGDVFTVEPGLYSPALRGGLRQENNYLVTEEGVERLSDLPLTPVW